MRQRVRLTNLVVISSILASTFGCASYKKSMSPLDYMASRDYQQREAMKGSLFSSDTSVLGNADIERILTTKISLPQNARLAVLRLDERGGYWSYDSAIWEQNAVAQLLDSLGTCKRLASASTLPDILVPREPTMPQLREAAARFQSDLLLVYRVKKGSYEKYRYVKPDQAKAYCGVEALLLDVRTGVVPFTAKASEEFQVQETADDFSFVETVNKAEGEALGKALVLVANELSAFLESVP